MALPSRASKQVSPILWDATVAVVGLCGRLATPSGLEGLALTADDDSSVEVRRLVVSVGTPARALLVLTPFSAEASRIRVLDSGVEVAQYAVRGGDSHECPRSTEPDELQVVSCGAWIRIAWTALPAARLKERDFPDLQLWLGRRRLPIITQIAEYEGRRTVVFSGAIDPNQRYRLVSLGVPSDPSNARMKRSIAFSVAD